MFDQLKRARSVKDLCDVLQVDYTEKYTDVASRGEKSAAAKAADRMCQRCISNGSQTNPTSRRKDHQITRCIK